MQGSIDNDMSLSGRFNYRWNAGLVTKSSVSLQPGADMLSLEADYNGADFHASFKAINPSILEGGLTGMVAGDYFQSITPAVALGISTLWQRTGMSAGPELHMSYAARYKARDWSASARLLPTGGIQTTYWHRVAERLEAGVDLNLQFQQSPYGGAMKKDGIATVGTKYEFRRSAFRAQVDSQGRVAALLEKAIAPTVRVAFFGEIDHAKVCIFLTTSDHPTQLTTFSERIQGRTVNVH
jgi:mitochondrial import receptor subunit TOM40